MDKKSWSDIWRREYASRPDDYATHRIRRSRDQMSHLAHYDFLTELPNRRKLFEIFKGMSHALVAERRSSNFKSIGVVVVDVDNFKGVNDALGHKRGDELLVAIANLFRDNLRDQDVVARTGGDEMALLMPIPDEEVLQHVLLEERGLDPDKKKGVIPSVIRNLPDVGVPYSLSVGYSLVTMDDINTLGWRESLDTAMNRADENMYSMKRAKTPLLKKLFQRLGR